MDWTQLWPTDETPPSIGAPLEDRAPDIRAYFPAPGGARYIVNRIPSASERRRRSAETGQDEHARFLAEAPGMAETMEPDGSGMHISQTIDYGLILDGEIDMAFDDDARQRFRAGDS